MKIISAFLSVFPAGVEPTSTEPESAILSIKLWEQKHANISKFTLNSIFFCKYKFTLLIYRLFKNAYRMSSSQD